MVSLTPYQAPQLTLPDPCYLRNLTSDHPPQSPVPAPLASLAISAYQALSCFGVSALAELSAWNVLSSTAHTSSKTLYFLSWVFFLYSIIYF